MMNVYAEADVEQGYYGGVDGVTVDMLIDVTCSSCKRVVYRKEIRGPMDMYDMAKVGA